jgi:glyoxylase-like metal-dependent hydrolase (beta-lactamase superfamily II)
MAPNGTLGYDVFISEPIPIAVDPPLTTDQAASVGDWIKSNRKNVTHIVATHGQGDHWFTAGVPPIGLTRGSSPPAARSSRCTTTWPAAGPCGTRHIPGRSRRPPSATPTASWAPTILWAGAQALYAIRDGHDTISAVIGGWLH